MRTAFLLVSTGLDIRPRFPRRPRDAGTIASRSRTGPRTARWLRRGREGRRRPRSQRSPHGR